MSRPKKGCLSAAEIQTFDRLLEGVAPKQIAWERGEHYVTVRMRLARIRKDLGAKTLIQAAVLYVSPKKT